MTQLRPTYTVTRDPAEQQRRAKREPWKAIAADYGISHATLMNAVARYRAAARKLMRETNQ